MFVFTEQHKKGVTVVIGLLLVLSFIVLAASQYQAQVIPVQEENTEIEHNRMIRGQMAELESQVAGSANSDEIRTQQIQLGTRYESRIIFGIIPAIHQPAPAGTLEYEKAEDNLIIRNAQGQRGSEEFWSGADKGAPADENYTTGWISYQPDYRHLQDAPNTYYENGITYDEYEKDPDIETDNEYVYLSNQNFIKDNNINIVTMNGDVNVNTIGTRTIEIYPVSAPATTIAIEPADDATPITILLPTNLPAEEWGKLLEGNPNIVQNDYDGDGNLERVGQNTSERVRIELASDQTYTLTLSRVFLTTRASASTVPTAQKEYIAWDEDRVIIRESSRTRIDAQVRDKYDNPITGVEVFAYARNSSGECIGNFENSDPGSGPESCSTNVQQPGNQTSAQRGEVSFIYEAPEVDQDRTVDISLLFENN